MFAHADPRENETKPPKVNGPYPCPLNRGRAVNGRPEGWHWFDIVKFSDDSTDSSSGCACGLTYHYDVTLTVEEE